MARRGHAATWVAGALLLAAAAALCGGAAVAASAAAAAKFDAAGRAALYEEFDPTWIQRWRYSADANYEGRFERVDGGIKARF